MNEHDDLEANLAQCRTRGCALFVARQLVQARWERGELPEIQRLDEITKQALANIIVQQNWREK
jgi:hypothetical protein